MVSVPLLYLVVFRLDDSFGTNILNDKCFTSMTTSLREQPADGWLIFELGLYIFET